MALCRGLLSLLAQAANVGVRQHQLDKDAEVDEKSWIFGVIPLTVDQIMFKIILEQDVSPELKRQIFDTRNHAIAGCTDHGGPEKAEPGRVKLFACCSSKSLSNTATIQREL